MCRHQVKKYAQLYKQANRAVKIISKMLRNGNIKAANRLFDIQTKKRALNRGTYQQAVANQFQKQRYVPDLKRGIIDIKQAGTPDKYVNNRVGAVYIGQSPQRLRENYESGKALFATKYPVQAARYATHKSNGIVFGLDASKLKHQGKPATLTPHLAKSDYIERLQALRDYAKKLDNIIGSSYNPNSQILFDRTPGALKDLIFDRYKVLPIIKGYALQPLRQLEKTPIAKYLSSDILKLPYTTAYKSLK